MTLKCIICNLDFLNTNKESHKNNCCSYKCFVKSGLIRLKFLKTFLTNKNISVDNLSLEEMKDYYSKFQSKTTKISSIKKNQTIIKNHGDLHEFCKKSGKIGRLNFIKKELLNNNIFNKSNIDGYSDEILIKHFNEFYYKNHSSKIINGRLKKHGSIENVKMVYVKAVDKTVCNYFNIDYNVFSILDKEHKKEIIKKYKNEIKFYNHNPLCWKQTHLINNKIIDANSDIDKNQIDKLYSEYLSERVNSSILHYIASGYKKTKKGWYYFINKNIKYFYRSSWELIVLQNLDDLISTGDILNVVEPDRIKYLFKNKFRYYYPDIGYIDKNNKYIILEIKPKALLLDEMNIVKIFEAKKVLNNFFILSEDSVFSDNIKEILVNKGENV